MKCLSIYSTEISLSIQKTLNILTETSFVKRFIYNLKVNILPTFIFLIFISLISLYISDFVYQEKKQKLAQDGILALNTEMAGNKP